MQKDGIDPASYEGLKLARKKEQRQIKIVRAGTLAILILLIGGAAFLLRGKFAPPPSAYAECSKAIRASVRNPSAAKIPYVRSYGDLTSWSHGAGLMLQNDFGAMIDSSAACITDDSGNVTGLSINGETIF